MPEQIYIVTDLGFGDSGKGTMVDYLASKYPEDTSVCVIRFSGGHQCGHNVVWSAETDEGDTVHHEYHSLGSATHRQCDTYWGEHVLINPIGIEDEIKQLELKGVNFDALHMGVHPECLLVTPWHIAANRIRELVRLNTETGRHGSCGQGIGETVSDSLIAVIPSLRVKDIDTPYFGDKAVEVREMKRRELQELVIEAGLAELPEIQAEMSAFDIMDQFIACCFEVFGDFPEQIPVADRPIGADIWIFEGSQGVLLDEDHGFKPHTTWSKTTTEWAYDLIAQTGNQHVPCESIGVMRTYMTRHGAGPFPSQDRFLTENVGRRELHNHHNQWQGGFKAGRLDFGLLSYSTMKCEIDVLAVTHMDQLGHNYEVDIFWAPHEDPDQPMAVTSAMIADHESYTRNSRTVRQDRLIDEIEAHIADVKYVSWGPKAEDKLEKSMAFPPARTWWQREHLLEDIPDAVTGMEEAIGQLAGMNRIRNEIRGTWVPTVEEQPREETRLERLRRRTAERRAARQPRIEETDEEGITYRNYGPPTPTMPHTEDETVEDDLGF